MNSAYRLEHLVFAYGDKPALLIDHLAIPAGRITAVIGPNGAGKSTLLNLLAFLIRADAGEICFFNRPVKGEDFPALRRRVGLVAQNPYLLQGSVIDNVELGLKLRGIGKVQRRRRAMDAMARVGLAGFEKCSVRALSGGERQRVALARTLAPEPEVLLFDEPFTYLDQGHTRLVERLISDYVRKSGKTVVFSTHEQAQGAMLSDESVSLFAGRLVDASLVNLFHGRLQNGVFDTGKLAIRVSEAVEQVSYLTVDPEEILLSSEPPNSGHRNVFRGRVVMIGEDAGKVRIIIDVGEKLSVRTSLESIRSLGLEPGKEIWVCFKAAAVKVF
ncbi:ABC transporter, ATP-binding protein [Methylocaldum marinum]|uniref:ABC transporter, ATP-binding protein n=1 Tax=Methylocaldum marinum TaxID=1432792 RepID=A0A250KST0_9GAMM|nr:ATP-binding cassette domain-containing protein [Methylocaldum marinum]BBA34622.1 ABC transporter, ATP-binding protein [Methylocaldum marinum]